MKVTLLISTYKNPAFLEKVLISALRQSYPLEEIIVCEDGDFDENRRLIASYQDQSQIPVVHVSQKDIGNRKPLCVNKGMLRATGDYLVFVDGDCVMRRDFVADHVTLAHPRAFLTGRRVELSERASARVTTERVREGYLDGWPWALMWDALVGRTERLGRFFKTPLWLRRLLRRNEILDIRGCNFSVHREHMLAINGYSNDFSGAYGEDSDIEYRLKFLGLEMRGCKGACIQFHLWHPTQNKDSVNQERLRQTLARKEAWVPNGLRESSTIA